MLMKIVYTINESGVQNRNVVCYRKNNCIHIQALNTDMVKVCFLCIYEGTRVSYIMRDVSFGVWGGVGGQNTLNSLRPCCLY